MAVRYYVHVESKKRRNYSQIVPDWGKVFRDVSKTGIRALLKTLPTTKYIYRISREK